MSSAPSIGVGVIGLGFMGATHVRAIQAAANDGLPCALVAVADKSIERLSGKALTTGNIDTGSAEQLFDPKLVKGYVDPRQLMDDPRVHAVSICTHTDTHVDLAIAALRAGKHVLVEKPVAVASADVKRLADAAAETGKLVMPAMCMRFWPGWAWLKDRVVDGTLGKVKSATFQRLGSMPEWSGFYADLSRSGGALTDLHIHDADFVRYLFGPVKEVTSVGSLMNVTTLYRFVDKAAPDQVVAEGGQHHAAGFGFKMRYVVVFEKATADFDLSREKPLLLIQSGKAASVDLPTLSGYDQEIRHFIQTIADGASPERLIANIDQAVKVAQLLEAERASIEARRSIAVESR